MASKKKLSFVLTNFQIDIVNFITIIELELWGTAMGWFASIILDIYIYIINPTIRKLRILSPDVLRNYTFLSGRSKSPMNVGFGKDIVTGAYKVVLMYLYDRIATKTLIKTHVFNLSNGERTCIYFPYVHNQFNIHKIPTFANGSLYWLNNNLTITALDLHTELFCEVLPPSCFTKYSNKVYLWSQKDRLCICEVEDLSDVDIWGLQQEGSSVKWEKFLSDSAFSKECFDHPYWMIGVLTCYEYYEDASTALCTKDLAALI
ncbi:hypothetical protein Bca101_021046 [Brassica carinata]